MDKRDKMPYEEEQGRAILRNVSESLPFTLEFLIPSENFRKFFDHYWLVRWEIEAGQTYEQRVLTFPNAQLSFEAAGCFLHGAVTTAYERKLNGSDWVAGARFRNGALRSFTNTSMTNFTDKVVSPRVYNPLDFRVLNEKIRKEYKLENVAAVFEEALAPTLPEPDPQIELIESWLEHCEPRYGEPSLKVSELAELVGCEKRNLQRIFREYLGVSPKWILQRARLHEAIWRLENEPHAPLAELALELGYFDQAHLARDFAKFVRNSPDRYRKA